MSEPITFTQIPVENYDKMVVAIRAAQEICQLFDTLDPMMPFSQWRLQAIRVKAVDDGVAVIDAIAERDAGRGYTDGELANAVDRLSKL